jgi:hypothetical protein
VSGACVPTPPGPPLASIGIYVSPGFVYRILTQGIARFRPEEAPLQIPASPWMDCNARDCDSKYEASA